jgi:lipopolysaccharide export system permease protein
MPRLINIYVLREMAAPFLLSLTILTATALLSKVMKIVDLLLARGMGAAFVLWFAASALPFFLIYTIPISFLIAVLVAMARLSSDSELIAMKASGISLETITRPAMVFAVLSFALTLSFTMYVIPWSNNNFKRLLFENARSALVSGLEEKTFYDRFKGMVLYMDRLSRDTGEMEGVFVSVGGAGGASAPVPGGPGVFFARRAVFSAPSAGSRLYLKLFDGSLHTTGGVEGEYHTAFFSTYTLDLGLPAGVASGPSRSNKELYTWELAERAREIRMSGGDSAPALMDLHKRFALPASVFVFCLLGVPLGIQKVRSARLAGFSIAIGVVLAYYVLSTAFEALGEHGMLGPAASVWGSDVVFGAVAAYVFHRAARDKPLDAARLADALIRPFKGLKARA